MHRHTTLSLYELAWMLPSVAIPAGMLAALAVTAFGAHIDLPGEAGRVDHVMVIQTVPLHQPGAVEVAPGRYEAHLLAGIWFFSPPELHVPEGAEVTFVMTSKDVIHGFMLRAANVNTMVLPGLVTRVTTRFPKAGTYSFLCHEYCGIAHHTMWGKVIVEPRS